jgi:ectoine hydroxylase-related dioxygenase (phytanoyl-CoA dioxygenase family)
MTVEGTGAAVTEEVVAAFQRDGAVHLPGLFEPWVAGIRTAIEENKANPSWRERTYHPDDGSAPFFQDYCVWAQFAGYRALVADSPMAEVAARLMGARKSRLFHDHVLVKEPGNSIATPWHHDAPYYLLEGTQTVSFWIPVDPVPRERTIEFVAGSHRWGRSFMPTRFDGTALYAEDDSERLPDIESRRDELDIVGWAVQPGDAVAFSFSTVHGAPANSSDIRRRVVSIRWVGDDARFVIRPGPTSPSFPDLHYEDGDPFQGEAFPVLYPR